MSESLNAVGFMIGEKMVHFMADEETVKLLLCDDEYSIDYITRAALSGQLCHYGITSTNFGQMTISRLPVQEHANLPGEQNPEWDIFEREDVSKEYDVGITQPSTPDPYFHLESQPQPGYSNISSNITNRSSTEKKCVWSGKKNCPEDMEATDLLLELRGSEKYCKLFSDKKTTKQKLWTKIGEEIERRGFNVGDNIGEKCRQKFANLNRKYISYMQNSKKTGAAAIEKPPHFDKLHEILHDKHKIAPPLIIDSLEENLERNEFVPCDEGMPNDGNISSKPTSEVENDENENHNNTATSSRFSVNEVNKKPKSASFKLLEEMNRNQAKHNSLQMKILNSMLAETRKTNRLKGQMISTINKLLCPSKKRKRPSK